ncbi:thioredoxin domain-containing protein [Candidatus Thioglobus sp.]|nr:thioredoxin domain-containing protein [Candidatus Thioglobus sp.]MDB3869730.1 thioredoxin domain-containing protein [Candidatus Thioglobus sp.]MDB3892966.1 thioredoxin domain-containing protein [Candidatus Thioglobus sp.]MDC0888500.1 thioredoxin domain-containing protein [Candidatus Thioglobus sp.]MDC0904414.1 thioredoxin domain-containing protein [Candidatus Thioglobus sp.]
MPALEVNIDNFEALVLEESHHRLVVLDISAEWCGPCNVLEPIINSVASEYDEKEFLLAKIEAEDENMKIAGRYGVRGFPTVIAFINGEEVDRFHSAQTPDFVSNFIDINLSKI